MSERKGASYEEMELRRGPWTLEEDTLLIHYIASHGEGRWNLLARCSGLKRTGKSCRLRWLNYLKPDIKRGNFSPEEQFLILELHSKWGNRWSRIAQHLPGRTDNEIKNYWRTRVQKQAKQLKIDANSSLFREAFRCYWMPRLLERIGSCPTMPSLNSNTDATATTTAITIHDQSVHHQLPRQPCSLSANSSLPYYSQSAPPENRSSPSTSACSVFLPHPHLDMPELPPGSVDYQLDRAVFNSLSDGYYSMISNDYGLESGDLPPLSASSPSFFSLDDIVSNTDYSKDIGDDSLWSMDESYDMLKTFLNNS